MRYPDEPERPSPPSPEAAAQFWRDVEASFNAALDMAESERITTLDALCAGRPDVRREVEALLAAHARTGDFMTPVTIAPPADSDGAGEEPDTRVGATLSHYKILSRISQGGMGIVYRALDETLGREVALKLLPTALVGDEHRRRRFVQEARAAATLEHPHIAAIYEIDEVDGTMFIAMEMIRGETLTAVLRQGPMHPVRVFELAIEVAEGLAHAHERGIVHRDIKPDNVMVSADEHAKIIDFGLVKRTEPEVDVAGGMAMPTGTESGGMDTEMGTLMGTAAYMAPEQARGGRVDHRSDIFSFGIVLHEMLAGARPFQSDSQVDTLHAILHAPAPRLTALGADAPDVQRILDTCMAKDPQDRYGRIKDAIVDLRAAVRRLESRSHGARFAHRAREGSWPQLRAPAAWAIVSLAIVAGLAALGVREWQRAPDRLPARFEIAPPVDRRIATSELSPDGRELAFIGLDDQDQPELWVRLVASGTAHVIPGTENAHSPFWSPDGRYLGFFTVDKLKRVAVAGGAPEALADVTGDARGGTWAPDDVIVFAPTFQGGLMKVSARGGPVSPVTTLDPQRREESHRWPWFLPDGRHFLYQALGAPDPDAIYVGSLDGMTPLRVVEASSGPMYASPGWLLVRQDRALVAQPFDADQLRVTGEKSTVIEDLVFDSLVKGARGFTASQTGLLAARSGIAPASELSWLDRAGQPVGAPLGKDNYYKPRLSPDGQRLVVAVVGIGSDLWMFDLARGASTRFTSDPGYDSDPMWSRDNARVLFSSRRKIGTGIFQRVTSGAGADEIVMAAGGFAIPCDGSPDGRFVLAEIFDSETNIDLWILPRFGDGKAVPFLRTPFVEYSAVFSPDGRWVAYVSNESGRFEVYVRPFQWRAEARADGQKTVTSRWSVSTDGGSMPVWSHDGRELYYFSADGTMMAAAVTPSSAFEVGVPFPLFSVKLKPPPDRQYDVAADGRFLVNTVNPAELATPLTIALNWDATLRR